MKTETDRLWPALFHGWVELFTLFLVLFTILALWSWASGRGQRSSDRAGMVPWALLLTGYGLLLLVRGFEGDLVRTGIVSGALLVGGWLGPAINDRRLWFPTVLLAALMGSGLVLSALVLAVAGFIVLLLSSKRS